MRLIDGVIPALFTPFDAGNNVSEDMLRRLIALHVDLGVNGLYLCGGAGEGILLTVAERRRIAEIAVNEAGKRVPIIIHVGAARTEDAAELAAHAEKVGADAVASVPPFFYSGGTEAIFQHYAAIANRCGLPLFLYNLPSLTGVNVTPEMMTRFIEIPTVVGMKFSSNNLFHMRQILELDGGRLNVMSGNDEIFLGALAMGAHGSIGLTLNFMPKLFMRIFSNFQAGHIEKAQEAQFLASRMISVLVQHSIIPAGKEVMRMKGFDCGPVRGPLETLTEAQKKDLRKGLEALGFFDLDLGI
jgi:N-acetylneuraminate lyase